MAWWTEAAAVGALVAAVAAVVAAIVKRPGIFGNCNQPATVAV